jgi:hypothetical protein
MTRNPLRQSAARPIEVTSISGENARTSVSVVEWNSSAGATSNIRGSSRLTT